MFNMSIFVGVLMRAKLPLCVPSRMYTPYTRPDVLQIYIEYLTFEWAYVLLYFKLYVQILCLLLWTQKILFYFISKFLDWCLTCFGLNVYISFWVVFCSSIYRQTYNIIMMVYVNIYINTHSHALHTHSTHTHIHSNALEVKYLCFACNPAIA